MPLRVIRVNRAGVGHGIEFRWGAIFSGAFTALAFGLFFLILGNAVGLRVTNITSPTMNGALRFWSWIYVAATLVFSYFLGGLFGTRSNTIVSSASGALHALISWALASSVAAVIGTYLSPTFRLVFTGGAPNTVNWLAVCCTGLGLLASIIGGVTNKEAVQYTKAVPEKPETEKRIA